MSSTSGLVCRVTRSTSFERTTTYGLGYQVIYARIYSSVRTNRKFLSAGPAPCWLWVCGLLYCQEGLTDGVIPSEAIEFLGVKNARRLAGHLVTAGLWEVVEGGWRIHDYLDHNKPAAEVRRITNERREGGKKGGRKPSDRREGQPSDSVEGQPSRLTMSETFPVYVYGSASGSVSDLKEESPRETIPLDVAFESFKSLYPKARRVIGMSQRLYFDAVSSGKVTPEQLTRALQNHLASDQWQDARHIPNMQKWFEEQRWEQVLPPPGEGRKAADSRPEWAQKAQARS